MFDVRLLLLGGMLCSIGLFGPGCAEPSDEVSIDISTEPMPFDPLAAGWQADVPAALDTVLRTEDGWASMAARLRTQRESRDVDFTQYMVLMVAAPQASGGYGVEFESVERVGDVIEASYVLLEPGPDCVSPMGASVPFRAITVQQLPVPVQFVRRTETFSCELD